LDSLPWIYIEEACSLVATLAAKTATEFQTTAAFLFAAIRFAGRFTSWLAFNWLAFNWLTNSHLYSGFVRNAFAVLNFALFLNLLHFANANGIFASLFFLLVGANLYSVFLGFRNAFVNAALYLFGNHLLLAAGAGTTGARIAYSHRNLNATGYFLFDFLCNSLVNGAGLLFFGPNGCANRVGFLANFIAVFWLANSYFNFLFLGYSLVAGNLSFLVGYFAGLCAGIITVLATTQSLGRGGHKHHASHRHQSGNNQTLAHETLLKEIKHTLVQL